MRIGILTSGGDAPGMNAILLGAAVAGAESGHEVLGIEAGFAGLADGRSRALPVPAAREALGRSGTALGTSRWPRLRDPAGLADVVRSVKALRLDHLVVAGGAGSLAGAAALAAAGVPVIGVPATIDGDLPYPTVTIGTDSAVNYAVRAVDDLRASAGSLPGRAFLVETLGGDSGFLARAVAEAADCPIVLTPEVPWDPADVATRMRAEMRDGYSIAVSGEGIGFAADIARLLETHLGARIRPTTLGHSMRGAPPSALDHRLGLLAGTTAILLAGEGSAPCALVLGQPSPMSAIPLATAGAPT